MGGGEDPRISQLESQVETMRAMLREAIEGRASAQRAATTHQRRYLELTARVPWAVLRVRSDGSYADVNPYFARVLGREASTIVDQPVGSLGEPSDWVETILQGDESPQSEVTFPVDGGESRFLVLKFRDRQGGDLSILAFDQTERAEALEEARRHAERADAANSAKSRFLAVMSHEIRTPMNGVLGMAELLGGTSLDAEQKSYLETILTSGSALMSIINAILDLTKIESGGLELEYLPFSPGDLTKEVAALFRAQASNKEVSLEVEVKPGLPHGVLGDGLRIRQVLTNLLSNALKFTREGCVRIRLGGGCVDGAWTLRWDVEDQGIGIAADKVESLFEAFTQADVSTTRRFGGTGLGLNISRRLVEAMQGELRVQSELGRGSIFSVLVPCQEAQISHLNAPAEEMNVEGLRVLLAEDNVVNQRVASGLLKRLGCEVTCAANGELALAALRAGGPFDVVLMDMDMPVMDGLEATAAIRSGRGGQPGIPIIALTANALLAQREMCLRAGMTDFLTKPVKLDELRAHLYRHARRTS